MSVELGSPAALWLLALVPLIWLVRRRAVGAGRRVVLATVRSAVLVCLAAALAQPVLSRPASRVALICLVDASHSVSSAAIDAAASAIDEMEASLRPDVVRIVVFGARTARLADADALRRLSTPDARGALDRLVSPEATNLEQGLAAARAELPAGMNARIVLFSDGHETEGDSRRIIERLAAEHVPVFTRALAVRDVQDTWIDAVRVPRTALAETATTVEVILGSQAARPVQVTLREGGRGLAATTLDAGLGVSVASLGVRFDTPGAHLIEAVIAPRGPAEDPLDDNNRLLTEIVVEPRPRVLYVHGGDGGVPVAARALAETGFQITDARPEALPVTAEALDQWDVVLLSNLARPLLSTEAMSAIANWVEERGGGLLFVGGPALVADERREDQPDYRRTELERVLPITFDREDEADVALVIVLDRSWSMNGLAMDLSKTAAEAAANTLEPTHLVGVLTFSNQATWDVPLARLRESRPTLHDAIARIRASGPTDIYLALSQAYDALVGIRARAKHLILLSDGQTEVADFEGLMRKMTDARVTVSSVALGAEADVTLLRNLATWGGGRNYVVQDATEVPEIFVKEAKSAASQAADETEGIRPRPGATALLRDHEAEFPVLQAHNPVTRKAGGIDLLSTSRGEPLLTLWPAGLGRTAMFAADVDGRWTRDWLGWRGFGAFLGTLVRSLAPRDRPPRALSVTAGDRQGTLRVLTVALEARDGEGRAENLLDPVVDIRTAGQPAASVALLQVGPGRYEARVVADATEPLTFALADAPPGAGSTRIFAADHAAEYRFGDPDARRLGDIAAATGGTADATADDLARLVRTAAAARHPVAPWLLLAALVFWLSDVGARRLVRGERHRIEGWRSRPSGRLASGGPEGPPLH
jgi:uncharacterized membrane protein